MLKSEKEVEEKLNHYTNLLETELGEDMIPLLIIIMCRTMIKYELDINWTLTTIMMGYYNEMPPALDEKGNLKYHS